MAKYPPKRLEIPSNQRTSIHRHVNMKRLKKLQQQSSRKTEATKVNAIIEQLDQSDRKRHRRKNNINQFWSLYESDDEKVTQHRTKTKNPRIVLSEK